MIQHMELNQSFLLQIFLNSTSIETTMLELVKKYKRRRRTENFEDGKFKRKLG